MARTCAGPNHRSSRRPARASRGRTAGAPTTALLVALCAAGASCLCPPKAEELLDVGFRTPRQSLATYQTYLRADMPAREYLCFSDGFRERNGLSAATYGEGRERLFSQQPWLKLVAKAEVVGERSVGEAEHWIDARVLGRTLRVKLVREAFYEIFAGAELVTDDYADFDSLVRVTPEGGGSRLLARVPLDLAPGELSGVTEVVVARQWKIDAFSELGEGDEPLAPGPEAIQP